MADQYEEIEEVQQKPFNYTYLKRMLAYTLPYRKQFIAVIGVMVIGSVLRLMEPYLLRIAVDEGITGKNERVLTSWLGCGMAFQ